MSQITLNDEQAEALYEILQEIDADARAGLLMGDTYKHAAVLMPLLGMTPDWTLLEKNG
jgi:hypothetical protein